MTGSATASTPQKHLTDPRHYRATYGTHYPTTKRDFTSKQDLEALKVKDDAKYVITETWLSWTVSGATLSKVVFRACSFHTTHGNVPTQVSALTFEHCDFNTCFMGFVQFRRTNFRNCTFVRCEMSRTEFEECTFDGCTFKECTPWEVVFQKTLIEPLSFFDGFAVAGEHIAELSIVERENIAHRHKRACVDLAEQLLSSNEERRHALYSDRALYLSRRASIRWRTHELRSKKGGARISGALSLWTSRIFLHLTKGGTSLTRLLVIAVLGCISISVLLKAGYVDATIRGLPANSLTFLECCFAAVSLFLAFGFTNLSAVGSGPNFVVILAPILGLAWSALVLAVIVRRAYR